jgi:integrase
MNAWVFQDPKHVKKVGEAAASWYVGWFTLEGKKRCKSCGPGARGHDLAEKERKKIEAQLITGTYEDKRRETWKEFCAVYRAKVLEGMRVRNREPTDHAIRQFERVIGPGKMFAIKTATIDEYVARRRKERGVKKGSTISVATINKELRHLRAVLRKAARWGYLPKAPDFDFLKEAKKLPVYVPPEDFAKLYAACDSARLPRDLPFPAADWWRALLVTAYMTGWRISALLALLRDDLNLDAGEAITRAEDNKGKRDQKVALHPIVVDHLRRLPCSDPCVLPWNYGRKALFVEFGRIQRAAQVKPALKDRYGFHDLRRAFATMNAERLTPDQLQLLMQHKDYKTTQRYIDMARQVNPAVQNLFVPDLPNVQTRKA